MCIFKKIKFFWRVRAWILCRCYFFPNSFQGSSFMCGQQQQEIYVTRSKFKISFHISKNDGPSKKMFINLLEFLGKGNCVSCTTYKISPDYQLCSFFLEWNILIGSCCSQKSLTPSLEHVFPLFSAIKFKGSRDQGCLPHVLYMYTQNYLFFKSSLRPIRFILHAD